MKDDKRERACACSMSLLLDVDQELHASPNTDESIFTAALTRMFRDQSVLRNEPVCSSLGVRASSVVRLSINMTVPRNSPQRTGSQITEKPMLSNPLRQMCASGNWSASAVH